MTFRPGELDQRVQIQKAMRSDDGLGGASVEWKTIATTWAHVRPLRGSERVHGEQIQSPAGYLVVVRYRQDVDESFRILWNGKAMNINFIQDGGARSAYLPMECTAGVAQ